MKNISPDILPQLLYLNIVRPVFTGQWPHRTPNGHAVDIGNARKLGIHNKGTLYNWLRKPPPYFVQSLADKCRLQQALERQRSHSLPNEWRGWWFDPAGRLTCGSNYANPYRWHKEDLLSGFYREQAYKSKIQALESEAQRLKGLMKQRTAANDTAYN